MPRIVLKKNKAINKIWHPDSGLVFKSAKEKLVVGRCVDDEFIPLDDETLDLCTEWKMRYDPSLVEEVSDEASSDGDDTDGASAQSPSTESDQERPVTNNHVKESEDEQESKDDAVKSEPEPEPVETPPITRRDTCPSTVDTTGLFEQINNLVTEAQTHTALTITTLRQENERLQSELEQTRQTLADTQAKLDSIRKMFL